jgi:hypothetical protein
MMRRFLTALSAALLLAQPLHAGFGALDAETGATLLLPYFEVDLDDPNGENTVFRVANAGLDPVIAHVVLWTDWAVVSFGFEIYVEANGAVDISMRDVFDGSHPAPVPLVLLAARTSGGIPIGECSSGFLGTEVVSHLTDAHTGRPSAVFGERCSASFFGDRIARGFVTVDVLEACTNFLPDTPAYFSGAGQVSTENVLWGTFAQINRGNATAAGERLVAIEADSALTGFSFFSNLTNTGGDDFREALPSAWGAPFYNSEERSTDVILWRDPGEPTTPRPCDSAPGWLPLDFGTFEMIDVDGARVDVSAFGPFPLATNRVRVDSDPLPTPYDSGWIRADLTTKIEIGATPSGIFIPFAPQAYMLVLHSLGPQQSAAQAGVTLPPSIIPEI